MQDQTPQARLAGWAEEGQTQKLPAWEELPSIPLYMDQVIFYLKDSLRLFERNENAQLLTSSMINNYVKNGVIAHPEKKKYSKDHLAALMAICMMKQVLSIQDIKTLLKGKDLGPQLYELFRETHTRAMQETCQALAAACANGENLKDQALRLAIRANAQRAAAERILIELEGEEKP